MDAALLAGADRVGRLTDALVAMGDWDGQLAADEIAEAGEPEVDHADLHVRPGVAVRVPLWRADDLRALTDDGQRNRRLELARLPHARRRSEPVDRVGRDERLDRLRADVGNVNAAAGECRGGGRRVAVHVDGNSDTLAAPPGAACLGYRPASSSVPRDPDELRVEHRILECADALSAVGRGSIVAGLGRDGGQNDQNAGDDERHRAVAEVSLHQRSLRGGLPSVRLGDRRGKHSGSGRQYPPLVCRWSIVSANRLVGKERAWRTYQAGYSSIG